MRTKSTVYLGVEDRENIAILKEKYGEMPDAEIIRLALRLAARPVKPKEKKQSKNVPGSDQIV